MTDVNNSIEYQSASLENDDHDAENNSFVLNQSRIPMDIDVDDEEIIESTSLKTNGHRSPSASSYTIENGNHNELETEDVFHLGNSVLNKSFDVLPQIKDDDTPSADAILDDRPKNSNTLDTTVELPNANDELNDEPFLQDIHSRKSVQSITTPTNTQSLLSNQFSVEYPYVIPQPQKNTRPSSPDSVEPLMSLTKNMKLNINKATSEGQDPSSNTDKTFDTNTFVLKKKDRRKVTTPATDNSFNTTIEDTPPDLCNKQSLFNTPSTSLDTAAAVVPRPTATAAAAAASSTIQQSLTDPTRIM